MPDVVRHGRGPVEGNSLVEARAGALARYRQRNRDQMGAEHDDFTVERYGQMARHLSRDRAASRGVVLDVGSSIGCGGARLTARWPDATVIGLDVVGERLAGLPDAYLSGICVLADALPLPDRCVDSVVAGELIEHLAASDVDPVLCEFQRVLRVGGRLILTTPNPGYLKNRLTGASVVDNPAHLTQHDASVLRFRLRMHGFRRIRVRGTGRVSRYLGSRFPLRCVYGSYLMTADKR